MTTHSIWSKRPYVVVDGDTNIQYTSFNKGDAAALWTENTRDGYFRVVVEVSSGDTYEFTLVAIGNSDADSITGFWDVKRNKTLVCSGCVGKAYNLSRPVRNYFKIYVGDPLCYKELWHFSGYITSRYDF